MNTIIRLFTLRTAYFLSLWFAVVIAAFVLFHLVPVDPIRTMLGPNASEEQVAAVRRDLGLDQPLHVQFGRYIAKAITLDFGQSFVDRRPVRSEIQTRLAVSLAIAMEAIAIIGLYLLCMAAISFNRVGSRVGGFIDFTCVSLPTLFAAIAVALMSILYYPYTRFSGNLRGLADWLYLIPPAFVLALYPMGILGRIMRAQIQALSQARYTRSALAMGLSPARIKISYVLRNAVIPLLAAWGNQLPLLLTSTFVVELVFSVPGLGALLLRSVLERDLPMMEGIVIVTSLFVLSTYLLLDLIYPFADPRIRNSHAK